MTHQIERVPFLAKYPIDKWEEEGKPLMSEEGWCELVMRVAKNKLDTLEAVFQAAKQTQTRLRHARGVEGDDVLQRLTTACKRVGLLTQIALFFSLDM